MTDSDNRLNVQEAVELLRSQGYEIKKPRNFVKRSFEIDADICAKFYELKDAMSMSLYDAVNDALRLWVEKKSGIKTEGNNV